MRILPLTLAAAALYAAGTTPKKQASDYATHIDLAGLAIGADYLVRTVGAFAQEDYLVVEVALYTTGREVPEVKAGAFQLRLNGRKQTLAPQSPGFVAAAFKYPDWEQRPTVVAEAGTDAGGVIVGRPQRTERFPGDPTPSRERLPNPPRAPAPQDRSGIDPAPKAKPEEAAVEMALPEGKQVLPVSGYLYFAHKGNSAKLRTVELLYQGPEGGATLRLK